MITRNTREDLERDNERLQKENWQFRNQLKVGCSNTDHNSLYFQLETSNNENQRLKEEINNINQNVDKILEENKTNIDLLLDQIKSLVKVNKSLNTKIENVNQQLNQQLNQHSQENKKNVDLLLDKIESLNQQLKKQNGLESKLNELLLDVNERVSKTCKEVQFLQLKSVSYFKIFNDWINPNKRMGFELLYRASENEFSAKSFHLTCNGKGSTITVIETIDGDMFGGFNSQSWSSKDECYGDDKCFIFTLVNKHGIKPTKYLPQPNPIYYVAGFKNNGPVFGDIKVFQKRSSYQSFPSSYADTTGKGLSTLTPTKEFVIQTIEIYKCI
ncbi:hypothetical protein CYY_007257 [Polysphondylium violaceum]|uniref:TLDc domain-containing protein n=1 Tax=Polysphondylium violaceum TaxID=133409 RepID=A0A8J4PPG8_9MYCE|nr:hypothetical protein CYY_007257 [Polysphondylium violaceum]